MLKKSLLESNKQTYFKIFDKLIKYNIIDNATASQYINYARTNYKKSNVITWYLIWVRGIVCNNTYNNIQRSKGYENTSATREQLEYVLSVLENMYKQYGSNKDAPPQYPRSREQLNTFLDHYLSLGIPEIDNYNYSNKNYTKVFKDFTEFEEEWIRQTKNSIPYDEDSDDEIVLSLSNGYAWVKLNRSSCNIEARAMGHCGNAGGKSTDRILSLRKLITRNNNKFWDVCLTFILDTQDNYLTERKGRGNQKPAERYFPYIIELLKQPWIKGLKDGPYLPERDFQLSDLDMETQNKLIDMNPSLGNYEYFVRKFGLPTKINEPINDIIIEKFMKEVGTNLEIKYDKKNNTFILKEFDDVYHAFTSLSNNHDAKYIIKMLQSEEFINIDISHSKYDSVVFFDYKDKKLKLKVAKYLFKKYNSILQDEYNYIPSNDELISKTLFKELIETAFDEHDEIINIINQAMHVGYEYGIQNQMVKEMDKYLDNIPTCIRNAELKLHKSKYIDKPCYLIMNANRFIELCMSTDDRFVYDFRYDYHDGLCIEEYQSPYHGYDNFDDKASTEYFIEEFDNIVEGD